MRSPRRAAAVLTAASLIFTAACSGDDADRTAQATGSSSAVTSASAASSSQAPSSTPPADTCGARELKTMKLRDKLAQLLVVGVTGAADARQIVERENLGGVFVGSWSDLGMLTDGSLRKLSKQQRIPLMVTVDQEGGRVNRLASLGVDLPSARVLGQTRTPGEVRRIARDAGRKMKALGITVDFAPSADVSDEPADDVIGDRSFSNDPKKVVEYAGAFADGLRDAGIMPVFKHFPGHGHGSGDTHTGNVKSPPLSSLITDDLVPFKELVRDPRGAGVMVGHLIVPGLTGAETPASISPRAIGMLRSGERYGAAPFDGVVFSDDLSGMKAISDKYPIEVAVRKAIVAGSDVALWLSTDRVSSVLDALERDVRRGTLSRERVDRSVVRILRAKGVAGCS